MKVPLHDGKSLGFDRTMLTFSLRYKSFPPYPFSAILDTGCPFTFLSKDSLVGKRIPPGFREIDKSPVSLGNCKIFLKDINNELIEFEHFVYIGIPLIRGIMISKIPCFIGNDFIKKHGLSIINEKGKSYLSRLNTK